MFNNANQFIAFQEQELQEDERFDKYLEVSNQGFDKKSRDEVLLDMCNELGYDEILGGRFFSVISEAEYLRGGELIKVVGFLRQVPEIIKLVNQLPRDKYQFGEKVEIFAKCCIDSKFTNFELIERICSNPFEILPYDRETRNELVSFILLLRHNLQDALVRYKTVDRQRETEDSFDEYKNYFDNLLSCHLKLHFISLDFSYLPDFIDEIELKQLESHLTKFHNNKRKNAMFNSLCGYITRINYSIKTKLHVRALFFFDGNQQCDLIDSVLAEKIGRYWIKTITKQTGTYSNRNASSEFQGLELGFIEKDDEVKRRAVLPMIRQLCMKDYQIIKPHGMPHKRLLNRGQI